MNNSVSFNGINAIAYKYVNGKQIKQLIKLTGANDGISILKRFNSDNPKNNLSISIKQEKNQLVDSFFLNDFHKIEISEINQNSYLKTFYDVVVNVKKAKDNSQLIADGKSKINVKTAIGNIILKKFNDAEIFIEKFLNFHLK